MSCGSTGASARSRWCWPRAPRSGSDCSRPGARGAALSQSQRTQGGGGASYRIRGSLVVAQLAMTVVLLIGAGLLGRSFARLMTLDTGFRTHGVVVAALGLESPQN